MHWPIGSLTIRSFFSYVAQDCIGKGWQNLLRKDGMRAKLELDPTKLGLTPTEMPVLTFVQTPLSTSIGFWFSCLLPPAAVPQQDLELVVVALIRLQQLLFQDLGPFEKAALTSPSSPLLHPLLPPKLSPNRYRLSTKAGSNQWSSRRQFPRLLVLRQLLPVPLLATR